MNPTMAKPPETKSAKQKLEELLRDYLVSNPGVRSSDGLSEVEVRFGTGRNRPINQKQFNQVVQQLKQCGFESDHIQGIQMLRVIPEVRDNVTGAYKSAAIRAEITGTDMVQEYCKTNSIEKLTTMKAFAYNKLKFTQKNNPKRMEDAPVLGEAKRENTNTIDFEDLEFRVSYKMEKDFSVTTPFVWQLVKDDAWMNTRKLFRSMNRVQFSHPDYPILADLSIVKSSMRKRQDREKMIHHMTIQQAEVFRRPETYEVELEIDNRRVGPGTAFDTAAKLSAALNAVIRIVLNGIQNTQFPIGKKEQDKVLSSYMRLIHGEEFVMNRNLMPRDFLGPSSVTLQFENIASLNKAASGIPNILKQYCVTDKADGERRLLYVSPEKGYVYLIDSNMNVTFTGTFAKNRLLWDSLLDGEHIKYDRNQQWVNRYAAFDIYFLGDRNKKHKVNRPKRTTTPSGIAADDEPKGSEEQKGGEGLRKRQEGEEETEEIFLRNSSVREYPFMLEEEDMFPEESEPGMEPGMEGILERSERKNSAALEKNPDRISRLPLLQKFVEEIQLASILPLSNNDPEKEKKTETGFTLHCKTFYASLSDGAGVSDTIFSQCAKVWSQIQDGTYLYQTDGLIFTPRHLPVGANHVSGACPTSRTTWAWSLKWKPPEFNTLDLLVSYKTDEKGRPEIHYWLDDRILEPEQLGQVQTEEEILEEKANALEKKEVEGVSLSGYSRQSIKQYRTLLLRCGSKGYGYINPMDDLLQEKYPPRLLSEMDEGGGRRGGKQDYHPVPFVGIDPYDPTAGYANIFLYDTGSDLVMRTSEGELFEDNMIVEFRYDLEKPAGFRWVPLRVRHDKTAELRSGGRNYGNDWSVCVANWKTIHYPITSEMITTGMGIPELENRTIGGDEGDSVYYSRDIGGKQSRIQSMTRGLRDFHNLFVKKKLILGAGKLTNTGHRDQSMEGLKIMDVSVGKGGDLNKFLAANASFVYGVDISKDNIQNPLDGVCARYLNTHRQAGSLFKAVFQEADSTRNFRKGEAYTTEKDKAIARALFGEGGKNNGLLDRAPLVKKVFGWAENGFEMVSCQFSVHYMFENATKMHGFMRNVCENTKVGGVFVCTTFDGLEIFKRLRNLYDGQTWSLFGSGGDRMFQLTKRYSETEFPDDEMGLGYGVDVYQESINKTFREYLVHPECIRKVMFDYGFTLLRREEAQSIGFSSGSGSFQDLWKSMNQELLGTSSSRSRSQYFGEYGTASQMTEEEKTISFLNRYYIFRKRHAVVADEVLKRRRQELRADSVWKMGSVEEEGYVQEEKYVDRQQVSKEIEAEFGSENDSDVQRSKKDGDIPSEKPLLKRFRRVVLKPVVLNDYSPVEDEKPEKVSGIRFGLLKKNTTLKKKA